MPELPDAEVMRRYLQSTSLHQEIKGVDVHARRIIMDDQNAGDNAVEKFREAIVGRSFESTRRHGKWMFAALNENGEKFLVFHFGMTGGLTYFKDRDDVPEYAQVLFHFVKGYHLAYLSQRKLGELAVIGSVDRFISEKNLGQDALDPGFDLASFEKALKGRRAMAKSILMDQETIAGIGNVYSDEILFQARIHPRTKINKLNEDELKTLFRNMKDVLQEAIEDDADPGQFPDSYIIPHRHKDGCCPICGEELRRVQVGSRHAYFCPNRQGKKAK